MKRYLKVFFAYVAFSFLIRAFPAWAATPVQNLTLESPRLNVGDTLVSASGIFELGIFRYPADGTNHYLCVRYARPIEQAVVWVANRDIPLSRQAFLELSSGNLSRGNLELADPNNNVALVPWSTSTANVGVVRVELRDTGNLVLVDNKGIALWASFNNSPVTDTLLPGQKLYNTSKSGLTSWLTRDNPASGNGTYTFGWGTRGNLSVLQLAWTSPKVFMLWRGGPYVPGIDDEKLLLNSTAESVYFDEDEGNLYYPDTPAPTPVLSGGEHISPTTLKRLTLDSDGGLRIYEWTISKSKTWKPEANWVVQERTSQCYAIGTCGPFGLCSMMPSTSLDRVSCTCPYGFQPLSATDSSQGCTPVVPLSDSDLCNASKVQMTVLDNVDMPWSGDYMNISGPDSANCQEACMKDCKCAGAVYSKAQGCCWKKRAPLYNLGYPTKQLHGKDRTAYIKISRFQPDPPAGSHKTKVIIAGTLGPIAAIVVVVGLGLGCAHMLKKYRRSKPSTKRANIGVYTGP